MELLVTSRSCFDGCRITFFFDDVDTLFFVITTIQHTQHKREMRLGSILILKNQSLSLNIALEKRKKFQRKQMVSN